VLSCCCFLSWRLLRHQFENRDARLVCHKLLGVGDHAPRTPGRACHRGSRAWSGKILLSCHWLIIKHHLQARQHGKSHKFAPALATLTDIANKSTCTAHADRAARVDNRSSRRRQHRTLWPRRRQRDTGRRAGRRNYTNPAEPVLFPGRTPQAASQSCSVRPQVLLRAKPTPGRLPPPALVDRALPGGALHYLDCKRTPRRRTASRTSTSTASTPLIPRFRGLADGTASPSSASRSSATTPTRDTIS
jgi:hypothetical protein